MKLATVGNPERFHGRTAWGRSPKTPLREFLRTETGGAVLLLAAAVTALLRANLDVSSYEAFWRTPLSIHVGGHGLSQNLRDWVNTGLMTLFFFVLGLEARREFHMGELRERRRLALPLTAGVGGMLVPVGWMAVVGGGAIAGISRLGAPARPVTSYTAGS